MHLTNIFIVIASWAGNYFVFHTDSPHWFLHDTNFQNHMFFLTVVVIIDMIFGIAMSMYAAKAIVGLMMKKRLAGW